jgi:very-short-patch-repair endonuclease
MKTKKPSGGPGLKSRALRKDFRVQAKDRTKQWRIDNMERYKENNKLYYLKNKDKFIKPLQVKICSICDKTFETREKQTSVCSRNCVGLMLKERYSFIGNCLICNKPIRINKIEHKKGKGQKYCSKICVAVAYKKRIKTKCIICDKNLEIIPARIKKGQGKFCSFKCRNLWLIEHGKKKDTSIELKMSAILQAHNIIFKKQARIEAVSVVDFLVPKYKIIIQCDGDYWHSLPHKKRNDKEQDREYAIRGYIVLRFTETDIHKNINICAERVLYEIKKQGR